MSETPQQYTQRMLGNIEGKDPLAVQRQTAGKLARLIRGLSRKQLTRKPAPDKWCIAEIMAHLVDTEIVASWRMRHIIGHSGQPIQAFDQNVWVSTFGYAKRDAAKSLEVFQVLRENNLAMLKALPKELWENYGVHQERGKESIVHIVRMHAGHDLNHLAQVEKIVKSHRSA